MKEVEEQSRLLEVNRTASEVVASKLRDTLLGQRSGNTYSATFSGSHNSGMQIGYSSGPITWNSSSKDN